MKINRQIACVSIFFVFLRMTGTVAGAAFAPEVDMELVGHIGGATYAVDIIGNYAYVGEGQDIVVWDVTNPSSPIQMSKIMTSGLVRDIKHSDNYAYVADDSNGLVIIDISNPSSPIVKGTCHTESAAIGVSVSDNYAYIADDDWINGLVVVDVSDPASPFIKGVCRTDRFAYGVSVSGNYAYVACEAYGLEIVDISNPSSPTVKGHVAVNAHDVTVSGNYAYVADASNGLVIIDISNPSSPFTKGNIFGEAFSVSVFGNYAYVHDLLNGLEIVDISNPSSPLIKGNIAANAQTISVSGNYAYVADFGNGLTIVDISNPSSPIINGEYHTAGYGTSAYSVTVLGNYAYIADASHGLVISDISNPSSPTLVGRCDIAGEGATAKDVSVSGDYAYVADDKYGLVIVDVSNPSSPIIMGRYYTWGPVEGVSVSGNYAYIVDSVWGFKILDISNPSSPIFKGEISGGAYGVSVSGNYAYITTSNDLKIVDISNPSSPIIKGSCSPINYPRSVSVSGNYAYVTNGNYGLVIIDISNPSSPMIKGSYYSGGNAHDVSVSGNYAYVSDESNLVIVNVSDPSYPTLAGSYSTAGTTNDVLVSGNDVYVADGDNCLVILEAHILNQELTNGPLIQVEGSSEVYLIENGMKRHFTSPEALEWNGYSLENITTVTSQTLQNYPDGEDVSISQPIIDKYHALGGAPIFGAPAGDGEKTGEPDQDGNYCSYVNFENGSIECFKSGDHIGEACAIFNPLFSKWASMGYGKSVLGYPISDMSDVQSSIFGTPFRYQNFANGTERGALEYNISSGNVFEIHGAIFAKWEEKGFANGDLGLVTGDEKVAASSKFGTVGKYSEFENGHIHWISNKTGENEGNSYRGKSFITFGGLDKVYTDLGGTYSDLGFPIMDQEIKEDGHGYCEFEGGNISWDDPSNYKIQYNHYISYSDFSFIQITDTHVGEWKISIDGAIYYRDISAIKLMNIVTDLNTNYPDAKFVLVTGDLVDYSNDVDFNAFCDIMKSLKIDVKYVPGNHDRRNDQFGGTVSTQNLDRYTRFVSPQTDIIEFDEGGFKFIGLDSEGDYNTTIGDGFDFLAGKGFDNTPESWGLSVDQINYLKGLPSEQPKIIFMHHPVIQLKGNNDQPVEGSADKEVIPTEGDYGGNDGCIRWQRPEFIEYCKANNVQNIVAGHSHKNVILSANGEKRDETSREYPIFIQTAAGVDGYYRIFNVIDDNVRSYSSSEPVLRSRISADLKCPANLRVYDSQNRCTGLNSLGEAERSIPNSFYIGRYNYSDTNDREDIVLYGTNENYKFEVVANLTEEQKNSPEIETFNLTIEQISEDTNRTISYRNVPLTENTIATLPINQTIASYAIEIDSNGDGIKDETREPDSVIIDDVETIIVNDVSPASIINLQFTSDSTWINWTWINPNDHDFNHTEIYLNNIFQTNISAEYFNATDLQPETSYTLSTRTVDNNGNVNETWVNLTATTSAELVSEAEKPVIQSVVLYPINMTAGSKINITVSATDNVGVTEVKAGDIQLTEIGDVWQGNIVAPSSVGSYALLIKANDSVGNSAEKTENYKVVSPTGSLGVGISPKSTTAPTSGKTIDYTVKIKSIQNFDDVVRVNVTMDGLPVSYQIPLEWFGWNNQTVSVASNNTISLPLKLTIPPGQAAGKKAFKVRANSTSWITNAYDSGVITIS